MPGKKVGKECYMARGTGSYNTQTWNTIEDAIDVNIKDAANKGDVSSRRSNFKKYRRALRDVVATGSFRYSSEDPDHIYMRKAYANGALVDWWFADGDPTVNTSAGPRFWGQITEFSHDQPLEDGVQVNFEIAPCNDSTNTEEPCWYPEP